MDKAPVKLTVIKDGPVMVECSQAEVVMSDGSSEVKEGKLFLCRCGQSKTKPYCDGTHTKVGFKE